MPNNRKPYYWRDHLKEEMKRPGFKQAYEKACADLGKALGTTRPVVSRVECGNRNLMLAMLHKIAKALGMTAEIRLR